MTPIEIEISKYPATGIINPFTHTKFYFTDEMQNFFNEYLLVYKDYPDQRIALEFAKRFDIDISAAKKIEHAYVVVNRARINQRIKYLFTETDDANNVIRQISTDFGLDQANSEKYVRRYGMDSLDNLCAIFAHDRSTQ